MLPIRNYGMNVIWRHKDCHTLLWQEQEQVGNEGIIKNGVSKTMLK